MGQAFGSGGEQVGQGQARVAGQFQGRIQRVERIEAAVTGEVGEGSARQRVPERLAA